VKGAEDENTGDNGNDPLGILDRHALTSGPDKLLCSSSYALVCSWSHVIVLLAALYNHCTGIAMAKVLLIMQ